MPDSNGGNTSRFRQSRPADFVGVKWMRDLLKVPPEGSWPRFMTLPHPDAVGSYGAEFERFVLNRTGRALRWWQRLAARRILEHDAAGTLVWQEWLLTLARQGGKSWLLRELALWRLSMAGRIGEQQLVMHLANKLSNAIEVQRDAMTWAGTQSGWVARRAQGSTHIASPDGSRWHLFSRESVYGFSAGAAMVDECWDIETDVVEDGVEPTMIERMWPQLGLISTAHPRATSLFIDRRIAALDGAGQLLLEWSGPPWLPLSDVKGWRMASPHWSAQREKVIGKKLRSALTPRTSALNEIDPVVSFRSEYLNQWPSRAADDVALPGERLLPPGSWESMAGDDDIVGPVTFAVDDFGGKLVAVAAAGRTGNDRIAVEAYLTADRRAAYGWIGLHAGAGSALLAGPALQYDTGVADLAGSLPVEVPTYGDTRSALSLLRQVAARGDMVHGDLGELAGQLEECRVHDGTAGLRVISTARWELVRVMAWAVGAVERERRQQPTVY